MSEPKYSAGDVKKTAGLSYRQLNDWDERGVLPGRRRDSKGWREFEARELFAIAVCTEIRTRFGVPVERLRPVMAPMLVEGANHFRAAVELMSRGMAVLLLTDLDQTFIMDTDLEISDFFELGFVRSDEPEGFIVLKVNPIVNRMLEQLENPMNLPVHNRIYDLIRKARASTSVRNPEEFELLRLIRSGKYRKVSVKLSDGRLVEARVSEELGTVDESDSESRILSAIRDQDYQTLRVTKADGTVVRLAREKTFKLASVPEEGEES